VPDPQWRKAVLKPDTAFYGNNGGDPSEALRPAYVRRCLDRQKNVLVRLLHAQNNIDLLEGGACRMLGIAGDERCSDLRADAPLSQSGDVGIAVLVSAIQIISQYIPLGDRIVANHPRQVVMAIDQRDILHQCNRLPNRGSTAALRSLHVTPPPF
jgi:hypothetical protein